MYYQLQLVRPESKTLSPSTIEATVPPPCKRRVQPIMWKRVTFHADEETSKVLEALSNKDNRSQFIRNAIKFYSDNLAVLTRIEERLAEIERQIADLRQKYNGAGPEKPVAYPETTENREAPQADFRLESMRHILSMIERDNDY